MKRARERWTTTRTKPTTRRTRTPRTRTETDDEASEDDAEDAGEEPTLTLHITGVPAESIDRLGPLGRSSADYLFGQCNEQRDESFPGEPPFVSGVLTNWGFFPAPSTGCRR
jgi:hypothetical protein